MTADDPITELLSAPLSSDWTVEGLAEQLLTAIAFQRPTGTREAEEFVLDAETTTDHQSRRLLRPLLACLASKSAAEAGTSPNLYEGRLTFKRLGHEGSVWILGRFENKPGKARVEFRRTTSPPESPSSTPGQPSVSPRDDLGSHLVSGSAKGGAL